jgi:DNA-binding NarL/FixJ family response regulator
MLVQNLQGNDQGDMLRRSRRSLLLIGGTGFIPDCNIVAVMHEFPNLEIRYAGDLKEALADYDPPLAALLIEEASLGEPGDFEHDLLEAHRDRVVALVVEGAHHSSRTTDHLVAKGLVRSVLPMNLRLETWLLALRLLLRGGEFAPIALARSQLHRNAQQEAASVPADRGRATVAGLTERELQVLQMVSTGCPNRVIADRFSLSEHTVKVHVHNIIRKLKARNRTAAAAIYLEAMARPADDADTSILTTVNGQQA